MKKIVLLQTSMVSFDVFNRLFQEIIPEAQVSNLVDEDLLDTLNRNRGITPSIIQRICQYCVAAEAAGADLIFSQCSSTREGIECARKMVNIPILMVDDAMAEQAVAAGSRIGVAATAAATLKPTSAALRSAAAAQGKDIEIKTYLADGALDVLMKERNRDKHDRLIIDLLKRAEQENDVIVLAQGSMVTIEPLLGEIKVPVLTSPKRGVIKARQLLLGN
ncbi:aspartate/glutamate racemase family protein [Propionivibrio dicarboxylicus]|uniref:Aspartate/glutamate racemase n=1 Tax=Propionivibrio dicarboxylicus TaxID=83767 RepID=A0A1G8BDE0_9RHOO|nr:aspartate/glutamate racemase family protein [Propionivibrio dicarboxylicus]SDH31236.1 Aspartate/glutamate racemase [Propionivibrio dicarboxylicus]